MRYALGEGKNDVKVRLASWQGGTGTSVRAILSPESVWKGPLRSVKRRDEGICRGQDLKKSSWCFVKGSSIFRKKRGSLASPSPIRTRWIVSRLVQTILSWETRDIIDEIQSRRNSVEKQSSLCVTKQHGTIGNSLAVPCCVV